MKQLIIASLIAFLTISSSAMEKEKIFEFLSNTMSAQLEFDAFEHWPEYQKAWKAVEAYEKNLLKVYKTQYECKILEQIRPTFFCDECSIDCEKKTYLIEHIANKHPNKLLKCDIAGCRRRFYDKEEFLKHSQKSHIYCITCLSQHIIKVFISTKRRDDHQSSSHSVSYLQPEVMDIAQNQLNDTQAEEQRQTGFLLIPAVFGLG